MAGRMAYPNLLRPVTQRLVSTPVQDLPQIAYFLASSISSCSQILKAPSGGRGEESTVLVHKLRTRLTSLLQDRSPQGRFTAVVLIKATIEAGGTETLVTSEPWIRGLIIILSKPDPIVLKKLCVVSITRIFSLTQAHPSLLREITTPLLPSFITACLNVIRPKISKDHESTSTILSPMLRPVLQSWLHLLPQNATTFRPFVARIESICVSLIGDDVTPDDISSLASRLLAILHLCAPKNGSHTQWLQLCLGVILAAHKTAEEVFHPVLEDWVSSDPVIEKSINLGYHAPGARSNQLNFAKWSGLHSGAHRVISLLRLLADLFSCETSLPISLPVGSLLNLTSRLMSVTVPLAPNESQYMMRYNNEVGRDEREQLWTEVPEIHITSLRLLTTMVKTLGSALLPVCGNILEQAAWVFGAAAWDPELRTAVYLLLGAVLPICGSSLIRESVKPLSTLLQSCCRDQLPETLDGNTQENKSESMSNGSQSKALNMASVDSFLDSTQKGLIIKPSLVFNERAEAARILLLVILRHLPAEVVPNTIRTEMDRICILTQYNEAMLASTLNPPPRQKGKPGPASVLPFAARAGLGGAGIEALLRPRMPVVHEAPPKVADLLEDGENGDWNHEYGDGGPNNNDFLFQLEESLGNDSGDVSSNSKTAMPTVQPGSDQAADLTTSLKRDFAALEQVDTSREEQTQKVSDVATAVPQDVIKKPRFEERMTSPDMRRDKQHFARDEVLIQGRQSAGVSALSNSQTSMQIASVSAPILIETFGFQGNVPVQTIALGDVNNDSSDSEIPTIDIEPDTEDEDDIEED